MIICSRSLVINTYRNKPDESAVTEPETAYDHLSEMLVQPGDVVQPGQLIGLGVATGLTTGSHLHWEVWVGGVQVNPVDWLQRSFP